MNTQATIVIFGEEGIRRIKIKCHVFDTEYGKVIIHRKSDYGLSLWHASEYKTGAGLGRIVCDKTIDKTLSNAVSMLSIKKANGELEKCINHHVERYGFSND